MGCLMRVCAISLRVLATPASSMQGKKGYETAPRLVYLPLCGLLAATALTLTTPAFASAPAYTPAEPPSFFTGAGTSGIAVDQATGALYVVAGGNVNKFSEGGEPENFSALGTNTVSPGGSFYDIAVDNSCLLA